MNKLPTIDEEMQVMYYTNGLKYKTQGEVRYKDPSTLAEAMDIAHCYEGTVMATFSKDSKKDYKQKFPNSNSSKNSDGNGNNNNSNYKKKGKFGHKGGKKFSKENKEKKPDYKKSYDKPKTESSNANQWKDGLPVCNLCNRVGHKAKDCKVKGQYKPKLNTLNVDEEEDDEDVFPLTNQPLN